MFPAAPTARRGAPGPAGDPPREGIVTPEAVLLEFADAGLGSRSLAFAIDAAVRVILVWAVFLALAAGGLVLDETLLVVVGIVIVFSALLVYPAAFETAWNGRTPGKSAMGLRVVTVEGAPIRFRHAAIRSALGIVDFLLGAGAVAILTALATRRSQRLGDLAAGTVVIRERQARTDSRPVEFRVPAGWEAYTAALDVSALRDDAYVLVRAFLLRVHELAPDARNERALDLAHRVAHIIDAPFPDGTDAEAFLVAVAAAHQARYGPEPVPVSDPTVPPPPARTTVPPPVLADDEPPDTWGT